MTTISSLYDAERGTVYALVNSRWVETAPKYTDKLDATEKPRHLKVEWRDLFYDLVIRAVNDLYGPRVPVHVIQRVPTTPGNSQYVIRRTDMPGEEVIEDFHLVALYNQQGGPRGPQAVIADVQRRVKDRFGE